MELELNQEDVEAFFRPQKGSYVSYITFFPVENIRECGFELNVKEHLKKISIVFFDLGYEKVHQQVVWAYNMTGPFMQQLDDGLVAGLEGVKICRAIVVIQDIPINRKIQKIINKADILVSDSVVEKEVSVDNVFHLIDGLLGLLKVLVNQFEIMRSCSCCDVLPDLIFKDRREPLLR